jgi:hypothetical protein
VWNKIKFSAFAEKDEKQKFSENNLYWLTLLVAVCFFLLFSGHLQLVVDFWSLFSSFL